MNNRPEGGTRQWNYARPPVTEEFIRHAERYGSEMVFETASEYLGTVELMKLKRTLDEVDKYADKDRRFSRKRTKRQHKMSRDRMTELVRRYTEDRIPQERIADHMGISVSTVQRLLSESKSITEPPGNGESAE
jgi:hypothetical protein